MQINLSARDILYAAILALFFTWVVNGLLANFKIIISKPAAFLYSPGEAKKILQRCCTLFPKDNISFQGKLFKRGMIVRVTTSQRKVIEGKFIGQNNENMVCVLTENQVVAHDIGHIEEIVLVEPI